MKKALAALLLVALLAGCSSTREIEFDRSVMVISHWYFGAGWLTIYEKDTEYERDAK